MKNLNIPLSLFDFFAVLLPGAVGLFGIYLFINPSLTTEGHAAALSQVFFGKFKSELVIAAGLLLLSYLIGQVLNALSELIDKLANWRFGAHIVRDLRHSIVGSALEMEFGDDLFKHLKHDYRRTFIMVEASVSQNMPDSALTAKKFIALAVMFQSLGLALFFVGIALVKGYVDGEVFSCSFARLGLTIVSIIILNILLFWSYRRYKRMWSQTMIMSFVAWVKSQRGVQSKPPKEMN